jgi:hypothetical protein
VYGGGWLEGTIQDLGLMDLPRLMDNLTVDHKALGQSLRGLPTTPQPGQPPFLCFLDFKDKALRKERAVHATGGEAAAGRPDGP